MLSQTLSKSKLGAHRLPSHQAVSAQVARSEVITVLSSSVPYWGSQFTIDMNREPGVHVIENVLGFTLSAIGAMTTPSYVPAYFFIDHLDIITSGNVLVTLYPEPQFLMAQLFQQDEDRLLENLSAAHYASSTQRQTLAGAQNTYYIRLRDFYSAAGGAFPVTELAHQAQLRITLKPLASATIGSGSAATGSIVSCNLLQRIVRLREGELAAVRNEMQLYKSLSFNFSDIKTMSFTAQSGATALNCTLNSITGKVSAILFVVRTQSPVGAALWNFQPVQQFQYVNSSGSNMVGGQYIQASDALLVKGNRWCLSTYLGENGYGLVDNHANVYLYSWDHSPADAVIYGVNDGFATFNGSEQCQITFPAALGSAMQVDFYAFTQAAVVLTRSTINKVAL